MRDSVIPEEDRAAGFVQAPHFSIVKISDQGGIVAAIACPDDRRRVDVARIVDRAEDVWRNDHEMLAAVREDRPRDALALRLESGVGRLDESHPTRGRAAHEQHHHYTR